MTDGDTTVAETHISRVFFTDDRAYKLLKPITTSFLDFSDRATRLAAAAREVELNRRLAPDVYLGLGDLYENDELVDRLIIMRRMPAHRRLSALVDAPDFGDHLRAIAKAVAAMHAAEPPIHGAMAEAAAGRDAIRRHWHDNFADLERVVGKLITPSDHAETVGRVERFLTQSHNLLTARIDDGWVRDGHGDLLAEDIFCLDDGPRILDCLAFADDLRIGDVLADVSFLAMDLHRIAGLGWARKFLDWYAEFSNEHHPPSLAHHYIAYRAHVRAKVAALRWEQGSAAAAADVSEYHRLTLHHLRKGVVRLIVVGGAPGTGKTTVASALGAALDIVVLSTDNIRDTVVAVAGPAGSPDQGRYTPERRAGVYAELLDEADQLLSKGYSVILDASWSNEGEREKVRSLATKHVVALEAIECSVDATEARRRITARLDKQADSSEATPAIADLLRSRWSPWPEAQHLDTGRGVEEVVASVVNDMIDPPMLGM